MFIFFFFFFNDTATTEIYTSPYTLSLHDALPISPLHATPVVLAQRVRQRPALERDTGQGGDRARRRCLLGRSHAARRCRGAGVGGLSMNEAAIVSTARTAIGR